MLRLANPLKAALLGAALALTTPMIGGTAFAASRVVAIVNTTPITSGDVGRRVNLLRLQRTGGNLQEKARQQLIDEVLMREEILRLGASVSTEDVEGAFQRFAASNKLTPQKLTQILDQAGVTANHFKAYIAVQMSWPRVVSARYGGGGNKAVQDLVTRMNERGEKPKTNEYILQQVIFVVPEKKRSSLLGKRKREAEASRKNYPGCDQGKTFAATMHDVAIRDLGRIMEPQLPERWEKQVIKTPVGGTTGAQVTEKGVEYLAVCSKREVSDDTAAEVVFQAEDLKNADSKSDDPNSERYLKDLRAKAQIVKK